VYDSFPEKGLRPFVHHIAHAPGGRLTTTAIEPSQDLPPPTSDRRAEWCAQLDHWTDRPLTMLAVVLVPLLLIPFLFELPAETDAALIDVVYIIWGVFAVSLAAALIVSPDRRGYLRRHWLDVFLVVIPVLAPLSPARTLHVFWAVGAGGRVLDGSRRHVLRRGTGFLLIGASLVVAVAAGLIVAVEGDAPDATIRTYGDGLWWAMTTFATVGYGDKYPVTAAGRGIAVALMLLGIAAFGVITANLAALFVEEQEDEAKLHLLQLDERLGRMETFLRRPRNDPATLAVLRQKVRKATNTRNKGRRRGGKRRGGKGTSPNGAVGAGARSRG
jgi:voltage-gated potassium channel